MTSAAIMFQGTGSNAGKSMLVAGLCRLLADRGLKVRPFKPQNMSNNAGVTADGGEIGRAQMLQARAARVAPSVDMNPVLLKPEGETGSQVVVLGKRLQSMRARDYFKFRPSLMPTILESFDRLCFEADIVIVEGAGSASEVNLRIGDIANMGFAEAARVPVVLVGDIDRGGVIASLVGTHAVIGEAERALVRGFVINKFRGDVSLFAEGGRIISERTGWPGLGVVPWFPDAHRLPAEDTLDLASRPRAKGKGVKIAVPLLPRIANHDDLDPLAQGPGVELVLVNRGQPIPADTDIVLLPGSKATIADLAAMRDEGWDVDIKAHARRGGRVVGLCGGYQMLGTVIRDPQGIEGPPGEISGLGLLDVETTLTEEKRLVEVSGKHFASGTDVRGYEMHIGVTEGPARANAFLTIDGNPEGATNGLISGTYLHGLFASDTFRRAFLGGNSDGDFAYEQTVEATLDKLARHLEQHLDIEKILAIARSRGTS